jgi:hypothetical protein
MHSATALLTPHPDGIPRPARDVERMEGRQLSHRCQSDAQNTSRCKRWCGWTLRPHVKQKHVKERHCSRGVAELRIRPGRRLGHR